MSNPGSFWDDRFSDEQHVYGVQPNSFVREAADSWFPGSQEVLALGAREGRTAVYLARQGRTVTAVDYSVEGLRTPRHFADEVGG